MNENHKAGFVSIVGNPNVGKSTLMNAWVGEKLSIITPKAQTTRHRILGILNAEDYQLVLSDTPGVITPSYEMQSSMMDFVKTALEDADVLIYMLEVGETQMKDQKLFEKIQRLSIPVLVLINKIDTTDQAALIASVEHWQGLFPQANIFPISAKTGFSVQEVLDHLISLLPLSPPYYPKDQMTDKSERFFVNEAIREQILQHYDKEVPYAVEVVTEEFKETEKIIKIRSLIMVERETQKGILIGHKGSALKKVGVGARMKLQAFFTKKVHLELYVKVNKDWRSNERQLKRFGYKY
ncbi:MAG: GTPase Era [Flavobacteriaceae bacterium]|jgi:GTP-binding protein Era|nr:GTPase Era [Flavobacteriaceae bacterium]